ncbi:MAG: UvrD-helicase domain-containing protein [Truepera sp.]|nr:UvrD-helicase domain-containing protein [Truepera sp.]
MAGFTATELPDSQARITALVDHERTLLVEAGAGSGKTALMAGRVALMVAAGVQPKEIVAITFTEAAASELLERVESFVRTLCDGEVPAELGVALPQGLTDEQRGSLQAGAAALDEITCTTIHGFCQQLIRPYPVETGLDPGAGIIDPAAAELIYQELMEAWLSARFGRNRGTGGLGRIPPVEGAGGEGDFFTELLLRAPDDTLELIKETAQFLKVHRTARAARDQIDQAAFAQFSGAVTEFAAWYDACGVVEPVTAELIEDLDRVAGLVREAEAGPLTGRLIAELLFHEAPSACKQGKREFKQWRVKTRWREAARAVGGSAAAGERLSATGEAHYQACGEAYGALCASIGGLAFVHFVAEFDTLRDRYRDHKRNAALLDFDDLLHHARDLVKESERVRSALANRYPRILVDEFQDTDPLQAEILWRLAGEGDPAGPWHELAIRPGALFLVGDPKQAIYRFRGADVQTYLVAKRALAERDQTAILEITANFRSQAPILEYVNQHFEEMLDESQAQPGFTALSSTRPAGDEPSVVAFEIVLDERHKNTSESLRQEEATVVTDIVQRLIGTYPVWETSEKKFRPARASDISLLAPTGTSLWIYEQALEECGIPVATQAGKGFFRRQEVQDLIAIARAIADHRDTLAFGALIRGPLVGLTEEQIADEIESLRAMRRGERRLNLGTDPERVGNAVLKHTLTVLQTLVCKAHRTTPYHLLAEAIDELHVRSILKARHRRSAERALANVELVLEMARAYAGRGIGDFARTLWQRWEDGDAQVEGRPDAAGDAVSMITMHSAKGLEWPIVIPINSTTKLRSARGFLYRRRDDSVHFRVFGYPSPDYETVRHEEDEELLRERIRLWYVALTRARDLLLLPRQNERPSDDWLSLIEIDIEALPLFDTTRFEGSPVASVASSPNVQDAATWEREAAVIAANQWHISWHQPSRHEDHHEEPVEPPTPVESVFVGTDAILEVLPETDMPIRGGRERGLILHKLMEEVLTGEIAENSGALRARAAELIAQLGFEDVQDASAGLSSAEMAERIEHTLRLPEIAALRPRLVPEFRVYASNVEDRAASLTAGIADAVAIDQTGHIAVVVDWKSDVNPGADQLEVYRGQIRDYLQSTAAKTGLIVFLSLGRIDKVEPVC